MGQGRHAKLGRGGWLENYFVFVEKAESPSVVNCSEAMTLVFSPVMVGEQTITLA